MQQVRGPLGWRESSHLSSIGACPTTDNWPNIREKGDAKNIAGHTYCARACARKRIGLLSAESLAISGIERFPGASSIYARVGQPLGAGWPADGIKTVGRETAKIARARLRIAMPQKRNFRNLSWSYSQQLRGSVEHQLFQRKRNVNATALRDRMILYVEWQKRRKKKVILYRK